VCTTCGRRHPGECHRAAGTCFKCGQAGHLQKDYKKNTTAGTSGQANKKPGASGRVFAITEGHATNTSGKANVVDDALSRKSGMIAGIKVKIEHQWASGLLQQLDIPVWKWDKISMDFVTGLPQTQMRHDAIWIVVDRLTKSAHFLPICKDYPVSRLAEIFQQEIVRLHGTPSAIEKLKEARTRQKSYVDKHRRSLEFQSGDHVFLKVSPARGVRRFGIKGKLSSRFI
nr:hypothetical protein [Tanacetum cinerariifolium]